MVPTSAFDIAIGIVGIWFLLTVVCIFDWSRYNRDGGFEYIAAMFFLPVIGIFVSIAYLTRRKQFGTRAVWKPELSTLTYGTGSTVQRTDDRVCWNFQLPGWGNLRRRLVYTLACKPPMNDVIPLGLLVVMLAVTGQPNDPFVFLVFGAVLFFIVLGYLSDSRLFANVTVGVDSNTGSLGWNRHEADNQLFPGHRLFSSYKPEIELDSLETVELLRVDQQYLARLSYSFRSRGSPKLLPIPDEQVAWFSKTLTDHGVELHNRTDDGSNEEIITKRLYGTAAILGMLPLCAVGIWFGWLLF